MVVETTQEKALAAARVNGRLMPFQTPPSTVIPRRVQTRANAPRLERALVTRRLVSPPLSPITFLVIERCGLLGGDVFFCVQICAGLAYSRGDVRSYNRRVLQSTKHVTQLKTSQVYVTVALQIS